MQCPTCGYQLSSFDKECPRCKHFERKEQASSTRQRPDKATQSPLPETQAALVETAQEVLVKQRTSHGLNNFTRGLATFLSLVVLSILVVIFYNYFTRNSILGVWVDKSGWNTYQFNNDGTATWDFHPPGESAIYDLTYTADGNTLTEKFKEMNAQPIPPTDQYFSSTLIRSYTVEGDKLVITNPDNGTDWTFTRQ